MHERFGGRAYDVIIDDGLHSIGSNLHTLLWALRHVAEGGFVVIEDIGQSKLPHWQVVSLILRQAASRFECCLVDLEPQKMFVCQKLAQVATEEIPGESEIR